MPSCAQWRPELPSSSRCQFLCPADPHPPIGRNHRADPGALDRKGRRGAPNPRYDPGAFCGKARQELSGTGPGAEALSIQGLGSVHFAPPDADATVSLGSVSEIRLNLDVTGAKLQGGDLVSRARVDARSIDGPAIPPVYAEAAVTVGEFEGEREAPGGGFGLISGENDELAL